MINELVNGSNIPNTLSVSTLAKNNRKKAKYTKIQDVNIANTSKESFIDLSEFTNHNRVIARLAAQRRIALLKKPLTGNYF